MRSILAIACLSSIIACGGGGGGGGGGEDAATVDSPDQPPPIDAPAPNDKQIGSACTPDPNDTFGQGDCPTGFSCLSLNGGTGPWCSKTCTAGTGDMCGQGYTGTGKAVCYLTVTPAGGGAGQTMCGVVCDDQTNGDTICPASQCDGTCPGVLACTAELTTNNMGMMTVVAKGCE